MIFQPARMRASSLDTDRDGAVWQAETTALGPPSPGSSSGSGPARRLPTRGRAYAISGHPRRSQTIPWLPGWLEATMDPEGKIRIIVGWSIAPTARTMWCALGRAPSFEPTEARSLQSNVGVHARWKAQLQMGWPRGQDASTTAEAVMSGSAVRPAVPREWGVGFTRPGVTIWLA